MPRRPADKPAETATRAKRTPEDRATEALGVAERAYVKAQAVLAEAEAAARDARPMVATTRARLEYVAQNPDLSDGEQRRIHADLNPEGPPADG